MTREKLFALLALAVLALTLATPIPAMADYLNHLARMRLLAAERAGDVSPYYMAAWSFYPNLAMDLIVPPLSRWLDVETAARLFVFATQALTISGAVAVEIAVKKRFDYAGFIALLFAYAFPFAWGFVNFSFGLGLALWGIACWIVFRETFFARAIAHTLFVAALFAAHLFALGLYGFTLGVYELWRFHERRAAKDLVGALAVLAAPALVAGAALLLSGGSVGQQGNSWDFAFKPLWPLVAANGYSTPLSTLILALLLLTALRLRRANGLVAVQAGGWLAAGFALLYVATPQMLFDTAYVDVRVLVAAALILPGFIGLRFPDPVWERRVNLATLALICVNLAFVGWLWTSYRADYAAMIQSFAQIDRGTKILVARANDESPFSGQTIEPMIHAPTLAASYDKALVSSVMALKGKQPLTSRPGYEKLNVQDAGSITVADLAVMADQAVGLFAHWPDDFGYLYVIGAPGENPFPARLEPLRVERRFTLYRIRKPGR
ncbi:hypothetical protein CCR94_08995 [Rhodoblastus sphagnicola]|uniref:Glycosyltransferase RgtA/B/C/D-like domain-containing protein n=1 Tax=Rhodoblastus sphagnicola TaxID=333368 RepID=A0A2S6N9Y2_9HYPH|nr:hypothetical protein [Rhodoblastus sphagnicola]MBB4198801.1 hypothetical protein [Rhodoblastus sphagnicola]PPQ31428.1 hypothetical protein CCR94_08995 [Rhodoblastus sphagnicola]